MRASHKRLLILFGVFLGLVAFDWLWRRWSPSNEVRTEHYAIQSTATQAQTEEIGRVLEALHTAYADVFSGYPQVAQPHDRLKIKLFRNRKEFRRCNRIYGWAEAFYSEPYCYQYYSSREANPYHWTLHEATHQLNAEVARLRLWKWLDEGIACYFSTSKLRDGRLCPGDIDRNTYPIWWLHDLDLTDSLADDLASKELIPLRAVITGKGGPDMDRTFNLYYIHWWSLVHFLFNFEDGKYRNAMWNVFAARGTPESFEEHVGRIEDIQVEWHQHLREQCRLLTGPVRPRTKPKPKPKPEAEECPETTE